MGRLLLHTHLGPSRPWLFAALLANEEQLAAQGTVFAPFDPAISDHVPSHRHLWPYFPAAGLSAGQKAHFARIAALLDQGKDVLCLIPTFSAQAHASAWEALKACIDFSRHEVEALTVVGRPALLFEYHFREWQGSEFPGIEDYYADMTALCAALPELLAGMEHRFGAEHARLVAETDPVEVAYANHALLDLVADFIGRGPLRPLRHLPYSSLFLRSHAARRIAWTPKVANNVWPPLDDADLMAALLAFDAGRGLDVVAPAHVRSMFREKCAPATGRLEDLLHLERHALAIPDWFFTASQADRTAPADAASVADFARGLAPVLRRALFTRLNNDAPLLDTDQQALLAALQTLPEAEFQHLGEVQEPVMLTVLTMTYNQENYIAQCMDSVLAQKTDFPVLHLVLDHCSNDATPTIISEYAARHPSIRPVLLDKHVMFENTRGLLSRCRTPYAALCDGDDYFTEPTKLQKQVDFLTRNQDCALCFHPVLALYEGNTHPSFVYPAPQMMPRGLRDKYYLADLLKGNLIQTNSVVYRWRFRDGLPDWFRADLCPSDWYWHLLHAETGKIGFIPEIMAVYRRHAASYYAKSFIDHVEHRRQHGMAELETYTAMNAHFNNRYFRAFAAMANGVFADFFDIQSRQGDSRLLDEASARYPDFALNFLKTLKIIRQSRTKDGDA